MGIWQPVIIYPGNVSDAAALTGLTEAGELVAANVQSQRVGRPWRTTSDADQTLIWAFSTATVINALALGSTNLTINATIKLEGHTANSWSGSQTVILAEQDAFTSMFGAGEGGAGEHGAGGYLLSGEDPGWKGLILRRLTESNFRYYRLTIDDPDNPDGYIQIGRAALDVLLEPSRSMINGFRDAPKDPSPRARTVGGQFSSAIRTQYRVIGPFRFTRIDHGEWHHNFLNAIRRIGISRDFFWASDLQTSPDTFGQLNWLYGRFESDPAFTRDSNSFGTMEFSIIEAR